MIEFKTSNNLDIEITVTDMPYEDCGFWKQFNIGTCIGTFGEQEHYIEIFGISNKNKGNGHLNDVLEYFEYICVKKNKNLYITHFENQGFKNHLINKRGFAGQGNSVIKNFIK